MKKDKRKWWVKLFLALSGYYLVTIILKIPELLCYICIPPIVEEYADFGADLPRTSQIAIELMDLQRNYLWFSPAFWGLIIAVFIYRDDRKERVLFYSLAGSMILCLLYVLLLFIPLALKA